MQYFLEIYIVFLPKTNTLTTYIHTLTLHSSSTLLFAQKQTFQPYPMPLSYILISRFFYFTAKWSSTEDVSSGSVGGSGSGPKRPPAPNLDSVSFKEGPQVWLPKATPPSPTVERKAQQDFKPIKFDSNSLQRNSRGNNVSLKRLNMKEACSLPREWISKKVWVRQGLSFGLFLMSSFSPSFSLI